MMKLHFSEASAKRRRQILHLLFQTVAALAVAVLWQLVLIDSAAHAEALRQPQPLSQADTTPLCRFGVNVSGNSSTNISSFDTNALRIGWYIDYIATTAPARPNGAEYAPVIRLAQDVVNNTYSYSPNGDALTQAIAANPGADWFIGNEPDRRTFQDEMLPHLYARAYHDLYQLIKAADLTAHIFAGSIVQPTPLRLQYLDLILSSYSQQFGELMPVDGWAIHNFILNEASCAHFPASQCWGAEIPPGINATQGLRLVVGDNDNFELFKQQIVRFRQWMQSRGYNEKPLYLSEYGVLMPNIFKPPDDFPPSRVNAFMTKTFDYLLNTTDPITGNPHDNYRLVQRLSWYSTNDNVAFNGYLFVRDAANAPYHLSTMGQNFATYTAALTQTTDLYPVQITADPPAPLVASGNVTFTLKAQIANSGNGTGAQTATVRFYDKNPAAGGIQIGQDQSVTLSGCGDNSAAVVQWPNVAPGDYSVYVSVDPDAALGETNEQNNTRTKASFLLLISFSCPLSSAMC